METITEKIVGLLMVAVVAFVALVAVAWVYESIRDYRPQSPYEGPYRPGVVGPYGP